VVRLRATTRDIALTACMAALYVVLNQLPGVPVIGVEGAKIGILSCVVPVFGFVLGPWLGGSAALLGATVSRVLSGANVYSWILLPALPLSAFVAGCLSRNKVGVLKGWMVAALVLGGLVVAWYCTWVGQMVWVFPLLHWVGLAIILIFRGWLAFFIEHGEGSELTVSVALCSFSATMVAQMYGTLMLIVAAELALVKTQLLATFFLGLIPIAAVERLVITAIATVLGVPIILAFRKQFHKT
jgi:uncharacterized membrane protein